MIRPDYRGGSIVNLMSTIRHAFGDSRSAYAPARALEAARLADAKTVVLLVIDGLGYDYLVARGRGPLKAHLHARLTSVFPSTTAAAITTFLTGDAPQQHGITGWFTYLAELGCTAAVLPFRPRHGGPPFTAQGVTPEMLFAHEPVFDRLQCESLVVSPRSIADSPFNLAHTGGAARVGYDGIDEFVDAVAAACCGSGARRYVYAYWQEFDALAHEFGVGSVQVGRHFAELEQAIDALLTRVAGREVVVLITADHGFADTPPEECVQLDAHPQLAATLSQPLCGEPRAAFCYVRSVARSEFQNYVQRHLPDAVELFESPALIDEGMFGLGTPHSKLAQRVGDYTLVAKGGATVKDWLLSERRYVHRGAHGGTSPEEMVVPLVVWP